MNRLLVVLLLSLFTAGTIRADHLGQSVEITAGPGWVSADPREPGQPAIPFPTLKYLPKDGRNASILLSLLPASLPGLVVNDLASLKKFNLMAARPYLASPNAVPPVTELKMSNGLAVAMSNEDPDLIGKPPQPGNYKIATTISVLLAGKDLIHCTILHDAKDSTDYREAVQILLSATVRPDAAAPAPAKTDDATVSRPGLGAELHLPPHRFKPSGMNFNSNPGYFSYVDDQGVMLSGWLDRGAEFKDMKSFWASERATAIEKTGVAISDESFKTINGWSVVLYTASIESFNQKNLRACRVVGDTWADIHLSISVPTGTWKDLESVVVGLSLVPKAQ
jgi:hypothetical protein